MGRRAWGESTSVESYGAGPSGPGGKLTGRPSAQEAYIRFLVPWESLFNPVNAHGGTVKAYFPSVNTYSECVDTQL